MGMAFCIGCFDSEDDLKYHVSRRSSTEFNLICGTQPTAFYRMHGDRKKILFYVERLLENLPWRNYPANDIIVNDPEDALRILAKLNVGKPRIGIQYDANKKEGKNNIRTEAYKSNIHSIAKIKKRRNTICDMNYSEPDSNRSIHRKYRYHLRSLSNSVDYGTIFNNTTGKRIFGDLAEMKRFRPVVQLERLTEKDIGKHTMSRSVDARWTPRRERHISIAARRMTIGGTS